jgi:hypothetical protein
MAGFPRRGRGFFLNYFVKKVTKSGRSGPGSKLAR